MFDTINQTFMATLEKDGVQVMNVTINVPDTVGEAINQLPKRDNVDLREIRIIIEKYEQSLLIEKTSTNKWQQMVDRVRKTPPLSGVGDQVLKDSKEFRGNFAFNNDQ